MTRPPWSNAFRLATLLACGLTACGGASRDASPPADGDGVRVTFLASEGVLMAWSGPDVLIDALFDINVPGGAPPRLHDHLTPEQLRRVEVGDPPFDDVGLVFVTHRDDDHVTIGSVVRHLRANPAAVLVAPSDVVDAVRRADTTLAERVVSPAGRPGSVDTLTVTGLTVYALGIPHVGSADRAPADRIPHLAYVVDMAGFRIVHLGDAEPSANALGPLTGLARRPDLAFVPHWLVADDAGERLMRSAIGARHVVVMHANRGNRADVAARVDTLAARLDGVSLFGAPFEERVVR